MAEFYFFRLYSLNPASVVISADLHSQEEASDWTVYDFHFISRCSEPAKIATVIRINIAAVCINTLDHVTAKWRSCAGNPYHLRTEYGHVSFTD